MLTGLCKAVVILDTAVERELLQAFVKLGASGYTAIECKGAGRKTVYQESFASHSQIRVEVVGARSLCEAIVRAASQPEYQDHPIAAYLEDIEVPRDGAVRFVQALPN